MKFCGDRACIAARLLVYSLLALCTAVWAGGENGPDDHDHDDGPNYFGFVKDTAGKTIRDAKVTADIKGRPSVVARTQRRRRLPHTRLRQKYLAHQCDDFLRQRRL